MRSEKYSDLATIVGKAIIVYGTYALALSKDFNEGQWAVLDRSTFEVDIEISHYDTRVAGITFHSQTLDRFGIDFESPHPEAIDEYIGQAIDYAHIAADYMDYGPSGKSFEEAAHDSYKFYTRRVGYFA